MNKDNKFLKKILNYAKVEMKQRKIREKLNEHEFFEGMYIWNIEEIYYNCSIKEDGFLYDMKGNLLSKDGRCMDEELPYFVNQATRYCEDDYYGTAYINVEDSTFVAVSYNC